MAREKAPSLRALIQEQRASYEDGRSRTLRHSFSFLHSGIQIYDSILYPKSSDYGSEGGGGLIDHVRAIHARNPRRKVRIMDYGCGSNSALRELASRVTDIPLELRGVSAGDIREGADKRFDRQYGIVFVDQLGPSFSVPKGKKFDLILSEFTLEHIFDVLRILRQLYRALDIGGEARIHLSEFRVGTKFTRVGSQPSRVNRSREEYGIQEFRKVVADLRRNGVDISFHDGNQLMVIKKTEAIMNFSNIHYQKRVDHQKWPLYVREND